MFIGFSNEEMAANASLSGQSHLDSTSLNDQSVSSRSSNRSLRVAEKEKRKNEAEDPFVLAWKYFSDGQSAPRGAQRCFISTQQYCSSGLQASKAFHCVHCVSRTSTAWHLLFMRGVHLVFHWGWAVYVLLYDVAFSRIILHMVSLPTNFSKHISNRSLKEKTLL